MSKCGVDALLSSPKLAASVYARSKAEKLSSTIRPPSLNQLAARINLSSGTNTPSSSPARPRLAASLLRTGSQTSLSTTSTNDSTAVNAPSTRSVSPAFTATTAATPPKSTTPSIPEDAPLVSTEPLTQENLKELNQESKTEKKVKGYKNIPSLDAITAHLAKARSLSVDGSARPPEAEMVEDPKTPGATMKAPEHPLQFPWTIYHDTKSKAPFVHPKGTTEEKDYEAGLTVIGEFNTVESFCRYFNWLKPPSKLDRNSNYHIFKSGIKPMWEDPANSNGGKWVLTMKNNPALLDRCWTWLAMALVGEELEEGDEFAVDRIQVWTRSKDDVERLNGIGKKLIKLLDVSEADNIGLEFQYNTDDRPLPNKFIFIQSAPASSFRPSFGVAAHGHKGSSGGVTSPTSDVGTPATAAFGNFGIPIGGTSAWRGKR
ncbi:translation initiation factor eIF 4e-like domain-containing protein [Suillus spraguei]|nr:translation initiation factor eIF 4e-like domain-containing protein [Suillus spraguei]